MYIFACEVFAVPASGLAYLHVSSMLCLHTELPIREGTHCRIFYCLVVNSFSSVEHELVSSFILFTVANTSRAIEAEDVIMHKCVQMIISVTSLSKHYVMTLLDIIRAKDQRLSRHENNTVYFHLAAVCCRETPNVKQTTTSPRILMSMGYQTIGDHYNYLTPPSHQPKDPVHC